MYATNVSSQIPKQNKKLTYGLLPVCFTDKLPEPTLHRFRDAFISWSLCLVLLRTVLDDRLRPSVQILVFLFKVLDQNSCEHKKLLLLLPFPHSRV